MSLRSVSSHGVAPDALADRHTSAVTLAEWVQTAPVYGWCTFEYTSRAGNQWSVEPPTPGCRDYLTILHATVRSAPDSDAAAWVEQSRYPLTQLRALAERMAGPGATPERITGSVGCVPWRPLASELLGAATTAVCKGRARGPYGAALPRDLPRLAIMLYLASLAPEQEACVLAALQQGEDAVCIGAPRYHEQEQWP